MPDYVDSGTVRVRITPSGSEVLTGSGTDAAIVRVSLVPSGYEGDFAISDATGIIVEDELIPVPGGEEGEEQPAPVKRANFIGEGKMRKNKTVAVFSNRYGAKEFNRFTGRLG